MPPGLKPNPLPAPAPALRVRELRVTAAGTAIVTSVRGFDLDGGVCLVVVGDSGSGKSSLLRALAMLDAHATADILLGGQEPPARGWAAYRAAVHYVHQAPVIPGATVRAALESPFAFRARGRVFDPAAAEDLLGRAGLGANVMGQDPGTLSGGERKRVGLCRGPLLRPAVLLADEPFSELDEGSAECAAALLRGFVRDGGALVIASHAVPPELGSIGPRVMRIVDGGLEDA